ncbi:MAG: AI-2E family transporter [Bacilli bacterium]|nr:AI-2E family transporter [Bacilli bacterium]MDD4718727.1 AI-2E family transporter [Bacilli bacterium]
MFGRKKEQKEIDVQSLNEIILLGKKILEIVYIFVIIVGLYAMTVLLKELNIITFILKTLKIIFPLFIGVLVAWLFDPFVKYLKQKGVKRVFGAAIAYLILVVIFSILLSAIIPIILEQVNDFAKSIPSILANIRIWVDNIFDKLGNISNLDMTAAKEEMFYSIEKLGAELPSTLPGSVVNILGSFFSGLGVFVVGLVIGFYLLVSFDSFNDSIITFLPNKLRNDARDLINEVNTSMRKFVQGTLLAAILIFIISTVGFYLVGLKGALLFGMFCGLTNVIPFIGPYIGGIPAVIVGFSQGTSIGILTLIIIVVVQFVEGNLLQPLLMSRMMKLHPVTIMLGLLVFGYYWGVIGMLLSTPIIAATKSIFGYFNEKLHFFEFEE